MNKTIVYKVVSLSRDGTFVSHLSYMLPDKYVMKYEIGKVSRAKTGMLFAFGELRHAIDYAGGIYNILACETLSKVIKLSYFASIVRPIEYILRDSDNPIRKYWKSFSETGNELNGFSFAIATATVAIESHYFRPIELHGVVVCKSLTPLCVVDKKDYFVNKTWSESTSKDAEFEKFNNE